MQTPAKTSEKLIIRMPANESLANAIRRSVAEIPTLAISEVEFYKNDSALYDEVLAHRIGLVALRTEKSMSAKTKIEFKLTKIGPCTVYASDLEGAGDIIYPKTPLVIIGEGHKLELLATAVLGKGIEHVKHTPGLAFYRHLKKVKSSQEIDSIVQRSSGLIKPEKSGSHWICDINDAEEESIGKIDSKAVSDADELLFIIESYGSLDAKDIFIKAIDALEDNLKEVVKALK